MDNPVDMMIKVVFDFFYLILNRTLMLNSVKYQILLGLNV